MTKTGRARTSEAERRAPRLPAHFAGLTPAIEFFIERVALGPGARSDDARSNRGAPLSGEVVTALDRWKALEGEGWDVTALVDDQATTMVGLGWRFRPDRKRAA